MGTLSIEHLIHLSLINNLDPTRLPSTFYGVIFLTKNKTNINIIARRTGKDVNSHTVLDGIITTIMATIQRINSIGSLEDSRNQRRRTRKIVGSVRCV
ncbi:hypothetical protein NGUA04_00015 [Salmonella enterica]|nr:hypothetical protein NGUA04_00015 [Salmonella enterica]